VARSPKQVTAACRRTDAAAVPGPAHVLDLLTPLTILVAESGFSATSPR
jgi:hypothetical protein